MSLLLSGFPLAAQALHDLGLKHALALIPSWQIGVEQAPEISLDKLAREGYRQNELVYACIREIATTAAEVRLRILDADGAPLPNHPLQRLLDRPNPEQSAFDLWEGVLTDLHLFGNAFLLKERSPLRGAASAIEHLWKLRPDRLQIVPGARRLIDSYVYRVGDREQEFPTQDVIHFRLPDPTNDFWGLSPLEVAARQIDVDTEASKFIDGFFRNAAVPFGIIKLKRALRGGEAEARRIGQRWTDRFRGLFGRFQVGVLDADADFQRIGLTQDEMAFPDLRAQTEARICAAFRVPPILVGVKVGLDRATYSNMAEARRFFWENTLLSLYRRIESKLAADLTPEFATVGDPSTGTLCVCFDFTDVASLRESRESIERTSIAAFRAGALTINDVRRRLGLEPLAEGDRLPAALGDATQSTFALPSRREPLALPAPLEMTP